MLYTMYILTKLQKNTLYLLRFMKKKKNYDNNAKFFNEDNILVCKIPLLARRTRPSARATIGYLVYK